MKDEDRNFSWANSVTVDLCTMMQNGPNLALLLPFWTIHEKEIVLSISNMLRFSMAPILVMVVHAHLLLVARRQQC